MRLVINLEAMCLQPVFSAALLMIVIKNSVLLMNQIAVNENTEDFHRV